MLGDPDTVEPEILGELEMPKILVEGFDAPALIRHLADREDTPFH